MELEKKQIKYLRDNDLIFEYDGEYYSTYFAEITNIKNSKQIQCDKCHDVFKQPFSVYFCITKRQTLTVCPNGCKIINDLPINESIK